MIRKAFEKQAAGMGFSLVELLSPCPTNLYMTPLKAREHVDQEMTKFFPLGEFVDKGGNK
jgi:2-oxoglutarate ferredoxin oxidoreductase subunit beta